MHSTITTLSLLAVALLASTCAAQVASVVDAGSDVELVDLGVNESTGEVTFVGTSNNIATVFYLSSDRTSLSSAELIGVRDTTEVFGISSDGSRVTGVSFIGGAGTEATTWLSNSPASGLGLGFNGSSV